MTNPIPPTQLPSYLPVVSKTAQPTLPITSPPNSQRNNQNRILIGSLIAAGFIGVSFIISQVLNQRPQTLIEKSVNTTLSEKNNPNFTPAAETTKNITNKDSIVPTPNTKSVTTTTVNNYAWLSERLVTDTDLVGKDGKTLDIMRNTIFAIHGRQFDTPELQNHFNNQPWYTPLYSPKEFPSNLLSKTEQRNVDYIANYQDRYNLRYFK